MGELIGYQSLSRRLQAIGSPTLPAGVMRKLALTTVAEAKLHAPVKTGTLRRSIHIGSVTPASATVLASARYAAWVERGTSGGQTIVPVHASVLAWPLGGAGGPSARLSGAPRKGVGRSGMAFARRVIRGATPAQPYMLPAAERAIEIANLAGVVIAAWDKGGL